ncbi:MAG: DNRLRE domain-containing protein [Kofleriaceae bacterium]
MKAPVILCVLAIGCAEPPDQLSEQTSDLTTCVTVPAATDATIARSQPHKSFGDKKVLHVGDGDESLLKFDLASLPDGAAITSATMRLYVSDADANKPIGIHRVKASWQEADVTYQNFGQRFANQQVGSLVVTRDNVQKSIDITDLARTWRSGAQPNHGLLLESDACHDATFVSREGGTPAQRPQLQVCYTTPTDHCAANPCEHGGSCSNTTSGFTCSCTPGYSGATCATNIDDCAGNPCQNGGACTDGVAGYTCGCAAGFSGAHCETDIDECAAAPCQNGGVCTDDIDSHTCACAMGYTGASCETPIDSCASNPCAHGGTCANTASGFTCACATGYTGAACEIDIDDCAANACNNGGTCVDGVAGFSCVCPPDWGGPACDVNLNTCSQQPCLNGGACTNGAGNYTCACAAGYGGVNCEVDINDCAGDPCQHDGVCVDRVDGYTCDCRPGYSGATCDIDVDECASAPCQNGGACTDGVNSYTCACAAGFSGANCEVQTMELVGTLRTFPTVSAATFDAWLATEVSLFTMNSKPDVMDWNAPSPSPARALWRDGPAATSSPYSVTLTNVGQSDPQMFAFTSTAFAPASGQFTYELHSTVTHVPGRVLHFSAGPGDTLVYVGGVLFSHIVGPYGASNLTIDLDTFWMFQPGETYSVDVFYAHRAGPATPFGIEATQTPPDQLWKRAPSTVIDPSSVLGAATVAANGTIDLLVDAPNKTGAVWTRADNGGFRTEFDLSMSAHAPRFSEGMALVLSPNPGRGNAGSGLGYDGFWPSIAIEIDMHRNPELADQYSVQNVFALDQTLEMSIHTRGSSLPNSSSEVYSVGRAPLGRSTGLHSLFGDRPSVHFTVEFEPSAIAGGYWWIRVYVNMHDNLSIEGPWAPILETQVLDIPTEGYLGFTAANGDPSWTSTVTVTNWTIQTNPTP